MIRKMGAIVSMTAIISLPKKLYGHVFSSFDTFKIIQIVLKMLKKRFAVKICTFFGLECHIFLTNSPIKYKKIKETVKNI